MKELKGNLYANEFFYELEKNSAKDFFKKEEIISAIKRAINTNLNNQGMNLKKVRNLKIK